MRFISTTFLGTSLLTLLGGVIGSSSAYGGELKPISTIACHKNTPKFFRFGPEDKKTLITAETDSICIWNIEKGGVPLAKLSDRRISDIKSLSCSSDGNKIAALYQKGVVGIWDVSNPQSPTVKLLDKVGEVRSVAFRPKSGLLGLYIWTKGLMIYDTDSNQFWNKPGLGDGAQGVPKEWDLQPQSLLDSYRLDVLGLEFSHDGNWAQQGYSFIHNSFNDSEFSTYMSMHQIHEGRKPALTEYYKLEDFHKVSQVRAAGFCRGSEFVVLKGNMEMIRYKLSKRGTLIEEESIKAPLLKEGESLPATKVCQDGSIVVILKNAKGLLICERWGADGTVATSSDPIDPDLNNPQIVIHASGKSFAINKRNGQIDIFKVPDAQ